MDSLRSWDSLPALRLLLPIAVGMGVCMASLYYVDTQLYLLYTAIVAMTVAIGILLSYSRLRTLDQQYRWRDAAGVSVQLLWLGLGYILAYSHEDKYRADYFDKLPTGIHTYRIRIIEPPAHKPKSVTVLGEMQQVIEQGKSRAVSGKVTLYIQPDSTAASLQYGDEIVVHAEPKGYDLPKNPAQFDYGRYQALRGINKYCYVKSHQWLRTGSNHGNVILRMVYSWRASLLNILLTTIHAADERAVATSLMLGYREYMLPDIYAAYTGSGVLHVLSVSGLHVGVLFLLLVWMLQPVGNTKRGQIVKSLVIVLILCIYALLTGSGAPVWRSVLMCSMFAIARVTARDAPPLNVLAFTALLLLIPTPYLIADVGFQLSYLAVGGMIYFYPLLSGLLEFSFRLPRFFWKLLCGSLSAQILTLPLCVYYFHSVATYTLFANMCIVPISEWSMQIGLVMFATAWCTPLLHATAFVFEKMLWLTDWLVYRFDALPYSMIQGMNISGYELVLCYLLILLIVWTILQRNIRVAIITLCGMFILTICSSYRYVEYSRVHRLIVYSIPHHHAMSIISDGRVYADIDTDLANDKQMMAMMIQPAYIAAGTDGKTIDRSVQTIPFRLGECIIWQGKTILHINNKITNHIKNSIPAHIALLSLGCTNDMETITTAVHASVYVFDSSCNSWQLKKWKTYCRFHHLPYHDCRERAFVYDAR